MPLIPEKHIHRRKRDLCRRSSFTALSVCKIRFAYETRPTDSRRAKRLSPLTNWKPLGVFSIAGDDSPFLCLVRSVIVSFYEHIPQSSPFSLVRFREYERRSSQWYVIRFLNHRILSSCRLMFDRSSGKGKTQIGMAKFQALKGFGEISTPAEGGSISPKKLCESNSATFERAAGTNKR